MLSVSSWAAVLAAFLTVAMPGAARAGEIVHVVAKGQTLGRIAKRYHTTVDALREINDLKRGQALRPGLALVIPEKGKEAEAAKKAAALRNAQAERDAKKADAKKAKEEKDGAKGKDEKDSAKGKVRGKGKDKDDDRGKDLAKVKNGTSNERESSGAATKFASKPKRQGFVRIIRGTEKLETQLLTRRGRLVPSALSHVSRMLRFGPTGAKIPIDPRLATLIGMVSDHFGGRPLHIVSGYRPFSPTQYTRHSKHNAGHAVDFSVEGVPNTVLRDFCRGFRNAGVGYYPNSSFVHMDVRTTKVYWVDYSRPGEPPRYNSARAQVAADESAGEVEGHDNPEEGGSKDTPEASPQPVEDTTGNPPTPATGDAPAPPVGRANPSPPGPAGAGNKLPASPAPGKP